MEKRFGYVSSVSPTFATEQEAITAAKSYVEQNYQGRLIKLQVVEIKQIVSAGAPLVSVTPADQVEAPVKK